MNGLEPHNGHSEKHRLLTSLTFEVQRLRFDHARWIFFVQERGDFDQKYDAVLAEIENRFRICTARFARREIGQWYYFHQRAVYGRIDIILARAASGRFVDMNETNRNRLRLAPKRFSVSAYTPTVDQSHILARRDDKDFVYFTGGERSTQVRVIARKTSNWAFSDEDEKEYVLYGSISELALDPLRWGAPSPTRSPQSSAPWCLVSDLTVRMVYRLLDDFFAERPDAEEAWKTEWAVTRVPWKVVYGFVHDRDLPPFVQQALYKIIVRRYYTNERRARRNYWEGVSGHNTAACKFCHAPIETLTHLFLDCPPVADLWRRVTMLMAAYIDQNLLPSSMLIFGGLFSKQQWHAVPEVLRARTRSVWNNIRATALLTIRDFRNGLLMHDKSYTAASMYHSWRAQIYGTIRRNQLYPQSKDVGQRVDRWLVGGVFAVRNGDEILVRIQPSRVQTAHARRGAAQP